MTSTKSLVEPGDMTPQELTAARLRAAVSDRENELRRAMRNLQQQTQQTVDLGRLLAPHMPLILAGAFLTGLWIGVGRSR